MSNDKSKNYFFENDVMQFESFINGNLDEVLTEFDELSDQVNLIKNLEDLINGEIVNKSENLAASILDIEVMEKCKNSKASYRC